MKLWFAKTPLKQPEFENQQDKLRRMSEEVIRQYQTDVDREVSDPDRLAAMYGSGFMSADLKRQAEVVAVMASQMLKVPNADVSAVMPGVHQALASVRDGEVIEPGSQGLDDSMCKNVIATGREMAVELAQNHPLVCNTEWATSGAIVAYLGVPVASHEGIIVGVLCVHSPHKREWKTADVSVLTQLSFVLTRAMARVDAP